MAEVFTKNLGKVCLTCDGYWDSTKSYERLCLVTVEYSDGKVEAYVSRKAVPAGVSPVKGNVTEYWQIIYTCAGHDGGGSDKKKYSLTINTNPSSATVKMNGIVVSSKTKEFDEGTTVTVEVSASGYTTKTRTYTLNDDITDTISLDAITTVKHRLTINTVPSGAFVYMNNSLVSSKTKEFDEGTVVNVRVQLSGYNSVTRSYTMNSDITDTITLSQVQPTTYIVTIGTPTPSNAVIKVDGVTKQAGDTIEVTAGTRITVTATADGYENYSQQFTINSNRTITPVLTKIPDVRVFTIDGNSDSFTKNVEWGTQQVVLDFVSLLNNESVNVVEVTSTGNLAAVINNNTKKITLSRIDSAAGINGTSSFRQTDDNKVIVVTISMNEEGEAVYTLTADGSSNDVTKNVNAAGGTINIPIVSKKTQSGVDTNVNYSISGNDFTNNNNVVSINVPQNTSTSSRTYTTTITQAESGNTLTITVIQAGATTYVNVEDIDGNELENLYFTADGIPCDYNGDPLSGATQVNGQNIYVKSNTTWNVI